jgi:transcriptional regulator with XRE-family HTH domain
MKWYDRAKIEMKKQRITQDDLIQCLGVTTRGAVCHYLNGRREPSGEQLEKIASVIGCTMDYLLTGKDDFAAVKYTGKIDDELIAAMLDITDDQKAVVLSVATGFMAANAGKKQ